jgi:outer membrane protein
MMKNSSSSSNTTALRVALVAAGLVAFAAASHAQSANSWMIGLGATQISPNVSSGDLGAPSSPGTQIDVGSDTQPTAWVTYMVTDHVSVEVPLAAGFKHKISGAGAIAGVGQIGTVKALPVTVFAQYRFLDPQAQFRPYVMLGATYARFYGARGSATLDALNPINPPGGTGLSVDSKWAASAGFGVTARISGNWFADLQYAHSFLKTTSHLSTGQSISTKLDPDALRIGVGMRF